MKRNWLLMVAICALGSLSGQVPAWQWSESTGTGRDDLAFGITTSINSSVVITGTFKDDSVDFGGTYIHGNNLVIDHMFVVKYDVGGNVVWARSATAPNVGMWPSAICSDATGNIYVTGKSFGDSIIFNGSGSNQLVLYYADMFIVKYDAAGDIVWAKGGTGPTTGGGEGYPRSISADEVGNVYMAGFFTGASVTFAFNTAMNASTNPSMNSDIFIVKYSAAGVFQWLNRAGGVSYDCCYGVCADSIGNAYITGSFKGSGATFGTVTLPNSSFDAEAYLVKYDPSGNVIWGRNLVGQDDEEGKGVACTDVGVIVSGKFASSSIAVGTITLNNSDLVGGSHDIFLASYDSSGNVQWATAEGSSGSEIVEGVSIGGGGAIYIAGNFYNTFSVGTTTVSTTNSTDDMFVAAFTSSGVGAWVKSAGGVGVEQCKGVAADSSGNIRIVGYYGSPTITFNQTWNCTNANHDVCIAALHSTTDVIGYSIYGQTKIYPNPTSSSATIQLDVEVFDANLTLRNITGQVVKSQCVSGSSEIFVDCQELNVGVYFYELRDLGGSCLSSGKLIVTTNSE